MIDWFALGTRKGCPYSGECKMNCSSCGTNLPPGARVCPVCGTPTPYNAPGAGSSPQYNPPGNDYYLPPQQGVAPGQDAQQNDPTVAASPYGPPQSTGYGAPSYGAPPPPPVGQYP